MHALWYALPVTIIGVVVLFIVVGLRYLYKGTNPPLWLQCTCIVPFMLFSLRYWYLPIEIAAGMFSGIYDPVHNLFPGLAEKDLIPCTANASPCSVLSFDYPKHVAWTIGLFDGYTRQTWLPQVLKAHILCNAIALCLFPWQLWLMQHGKMQRHRVIGRIIGLSVVLGTSLGWFMSIRAHSDIQAYGGVLSIVAFGIMWASIVGSATLGYIYIKKKDIENHKKWMIRCFGALFGSFFFWRIEALVLQWVFSSANGWLFYTVNTWLLGMLLFDYAARKSGFYAAKTLQVAPHQSVVQ